MPSKTPLDLDQWYEKVKATLPGWWLDDVDQSVLKSHMMGMSAVFRAVEENCYQHVDETFIGRCSEEMLDVHAAERLIPDLGYDGDARRLQVQDVRSRMHLDGIERAVSDLLDDPDVEAIDGFAVGHTVIDADYDDNEEAVVDWDGIANFFSVIVTAQVIPSDSFADSEAYADRSIYAASIDEGVNAITLKIKAVIDHYKAAGTLYRIFQRSV